MEEIKKGRKPKGKTNRNISMSIRLDEATRESLTKIAFIRRNLNKSNCTMSDIIKFGIEMYRQSDQYKAEITELEQRRAKTYL